MNVGNLRANSAGYWKNDGANTISYLCEKKKETGFHFEVLLKRNREMKIYK